MTPPLPLTIGFTGTRRGLSLRQARGVASVLTDLADIHRVPIVARHGCCVGGDEIFHSICRSHDWLIVGHPGPDWPDGALCARVICDEVRGPMAYLKRNAVIVVESEIMIAAPLQNEPQVRGGTWSTIRMALRALRAGKLRGLYVVGRDGALMDHSRWL